MNQEQKELLKRIIREKQRYKEAVLLLAERGNDYSYQEQKAKLYEQIELTLREFISLDD